MRGSPWRRHDSMRGPLQPQGASTMHASFTRTLVVAGLLATSLTGCQSTSLGKFSWKPRWPSFGRNKDAAVASNAATGADSTAGPWMPSQGATPGYAPTTAANTGYGAGGQYNTGYAGMPTSYTGAEGAQNSWATAPSTGAPTVPNTQYDAAAYAAASQPAAPQTGYYDGYGQQPAANPYGQPAQSYAPVTAGAPMTQGANSWDPAAQYGGAPSAYPQQYAPQGAPAAQMADNTRYPAATQYDGGQQWNQGTNAAPAAYDASAAPQQQEAWPPAQTGGYPTGTQTYPQYQQPAAAGAPQPYRPGGTTDYAPSASSSVTPASYDPSPQGESTHQHQH